MHIRPGRQIIDDSASKDELLSAFHELDEKYNLILDSMDVAMTLVDAHTLKRKDGNLTFSKALGYTLEEFHHIGPKDFSVDTTKDALKEVQQTVLQAGSAIYQTQYRKKDGSILDFKITSQLIQIRGQECILSTGRDITALLRAEKERDRAYEEMEQKVQERTRELSLKTQSLEREILKRQVAEEDLTSSQEELSFKNSSLEDMNTALKILLKKRDEDKSETEENIVSNVKELIEPYLEQIKKTPLTSNQQSLLSVVESNLREIVTPYLHRMFNDKYTIFTPREIQVANLVKVGKSTKEIAELLNSGTGTVEHHRKNIRKKLGLNSHGGNLRTYLISKASFHGMGQL